MDAGASTTARDMSLIQRLERLYSAVVSDCLDKLGYRMQTMEPHIRPLYASARVAGYAAPVYCIDVTDIPENSEDYYKGELEAVDSLQEGDVMVVSKCGPCFWGELVATAARYRGARGVVIDGYTRDTSRLIQMEFPTFVAGISPYDSLGRIDVKGIGVPIECGGVHVRPGDLLLADYDGIVVVPEGVAEEVIAAAEEKVSGENLVRKKLAEGMGVAEAFKTYGII
jgi:4-hydroxy-4-methyl-2-oxoglutarate aldolase